MQFIKFNFLIFLSNIQPPVCNSPAATELYLLLRYYVFFLMDSVSLGIADDQTESWNFVSVEQFKIQAKTKWLPK